MLLMDRGFLDGADLWVLRHDLGIDFVVPSKEKMRVTTDAQALSRRAADAQSIFPQERAGTRKEGKDGRVRWEGQVSVVGVAHLTSYDQYGDAVHQTQANRGGFVGNALNAVVVSGWQGDVYAPGDEKVFLTTLPVAQPLVALDLYDLRSLIENTAFRELKQGWHLESYPKKTEAAVRGHVILTLVTFTLTNAFRTKQGQDLAQHGIRRQRAEDDSSKVIIFAGNVYAIFDIEEVFILLGAVPRLCFREDPAQVRRRYGLSSAARFLWCNFRTPGPLLTSRLAVCYIVRQTHIARETHQ